MKTLPFTNDQLEAIAQTYPTPFHIYDEAGNVAFYSKMKAFKLKEDLRIYSGEDMG